MGSFAALGELDLGCIANHDTGGFVPRRLDLWEELALALRGLQGRVLL